jgi:hypothetical protein
MRSYWNNTFYFNLYHHICLSLVRSVLIFLISTITVSDWVWFVLYSYLVYTTTERVFGVPTIVIPRALDYKHMNVNQNTTTNYTERTRLNQIPWWLRLKILIQNEPDSIRYVMVEIKNINTERTRLNQTIVGTPNTRSVVV